MIKHQNPIDYKFSIVTPFYNNNSGDYIERIHDSVMNQTHGNWEWIVTDDFSTDGTSDRIRKFSDKRIRYVEQKFKKELFINPQIYSDADIVVQLDSDDEVYPKTLEVYNHFFNLYQDVVFMTCATNYYVDGKYTDSHIIYHGNYDNCLEKKLDKDKNIRNPLNFLRLNGAWGNLHAWRKMDIDFNPYGYKNLVYMDMYRALSLEERGKYLHLPRALYRNNIREGSGVSHRQITNDEIIDYAMYLSQIKERREGISIKSYVKDFDEIFLESLPFMSSDLNKERDNKKIGFFGKVNNEKLLKELYFDHDLYINDDSTEVDYPIEMVKNNDIEKLWLQR